MSLLTGVITASGEQRDRSLDALCRELSFEDLLAECHALDHFRRTSDNLYERVRALFFLYAIHRFHIPLRPAAASPAPIPFTGYSNLLKRRFEEAIDLFLAAQAERGPSAAISSALAAGYKSLAFQTLADQVRRSVRSVRGNQWMFRAGHPADYPLSLRPELLTTLWFGRYSVMRTNPRHTGASSRMRSTRYTAGGSCPMLKVQLEKKSWPVRIFSLVASPRPIFL